MENHGILCTMIEPSIALYGDAYDKVEGLLDDLLKNTQARYALLVDRKGFVLVHREALWAPRPPSLDSIATLLAGSISATAALAKILGESNFNELVQQGKEIGLYVELIGENALLVVLFDNRAPVGKVKLFAKKSVADIYNILESEKNAPRPELNLDQNFSSGATALLDDLFG